jgi:hypothetical protein
MMRQLKLHQRNKVCLFFYFKKCLVLILSLGIDQLALGDHAAMAIDFKGEGLILFFKIFFY